MTISPDYEQYEVDHFVVDAGNDFQRIDKILAERYAEVRSRSYFQYLISAGHVLINGNPVKKRSVPKVGDTVEVRFILSPEMELEPENIPLTVLFEDDYLIVINKPPGMVVHPAPGHWSGTFANALLYHCRGLQGSEGIRPGIVHRLDKETSGVLLAAKDGRIQQKLMELFAERKVAKEYLAICLGNPGRGIVDLPIARDLKHRKRMCAVVEGGRSASTYFETIGYDHSLSLVRLRPVTGRTHQIRVHMKERGSPILGDALYGNPQSNRRFGVERQMLHACKLAFPHPVTGVPLVVEAPVPGDMAPFVKRLQVRE